MKNMTTVFKSGVVFIDYPFEKVCFRYDHGRVLRKFYGEQEKEIDPSSKLYHDAIIGGDQISRKEYDLR